MSLVRRVTALRSTGPAHCAPRPRSVHPTPVPTMIRSSALLVLALAATACGGKPTTLTPTPQQTTASVPQWYARMPQDPNYIFATATATSRDLQTAVDKAEIDARNKIAQQIGTKLSGYQKRFKEEIGVADSSEYMETFTQAIKTVTSEVLNGSRAKEQDVRPEGQVYRAFVLMEMPIGPANAQLMQKIRQNQAMYTRFRASQAFAELDKEVEKYEESRKQAGTP